MIAQLENQPIKLYLISLVSLWERFGYYTMQSILVLYMIKILVFSNNKSYSIFAIFSALFYLMPIMGGYIADNFLGAKKSIIIGALILSIGYGLLAIPGTHYFYLALSILSVGGGLFIPNIATLVSQLYEENDIRREGGFSIFYTAINVGAFAPPLISAYLIYRFGWSAAFLMAAISLLISVAISMLCLEDKTQKQPQKISIILYAALIILASILILVQLLKHTFHANIIIFSCSAIFIFFTFAKSLFYDKEKRNKLLVCLLLIILSIIFSILYQQAAMSLTIFTEYNVKRSLGNWIVPTIVFRSLNPLFIVILGPLLAKCWLSLSKRRLNPSIAIKFGLGTCAMGLGFAILPVAIIYMNEGGQISFWWIVASYLLQTLGEMLVSPIGLSMVSELSPAKMTSIMMGTWYFATAVADALAGFVSILTTVPSGTNDPIITSPTYSHTFSLIGITSLLVGFFIIALSPWCSALIGKKSFDA